MRCRRAWRHDPPLIVYFRKRLTSEVLGEINEMILRDATKTAEQKNDDDGSGNSGMLTIDATCAPSNDHYPKSVLLTLEEMVEGGI